VSTISFDACLQSVAKLAQPGQFSPEAWTASLHSARRCTRFKLKLPTALQMALHVVI